MIYEYKVVPAPEKGTKAKGVKTPEARFALMLQEMMNQFAAEGWEYQRAETLPSQERAGLTSSTTVFRNVLVFRRPVESAAPQAYMDAIEVQDEADDAANADAQPIDKEENFPV